MPSSIMKEERRVLIHLPEGYSASSKDRYPVLYLYDAHTQFRTAVTTTEHLSANKLAPAMIVVGILHRDRSSDLTVGRDLKHGFKTNGRGEEFMDYVEKELIPYIDSKYSTTPYRVLMGHSVGGLSVVHALIHRPQLFNSYISLDGALWWDDQKLVAEAKTALGNNTYEGKALFLATANRMEKGVDLEQVRKLNGDATVLIRANLRLVDDFSQNKNPSLRLMHKYYPDDDHNSITLAAQYDALRYIFDFYRAKVYPSQLAGPSFDIIAFYQDHYENLKKRLGYVAPPEKSHLNYFGYLALRSKQYDKAEFFFQQLVSNYPDDPNSYDSLGDLYLAKGDKLKAIEAFKKGLTVGEMKETREKLNTLLNEK
nr:alpha/beta hydrolase-fold protein [uncultured Undibacterium sp.]